jgi:hypothetical protein
MNIVLVWILATTSNVNGGSIAAIPPIFYPTLQDCEHVQKSLPISQYTGYNPVTRCIQTRVILSK